MKNGTCGHQHMHNTYTHRFFVAHTFRRRVLETYFRSQERSPARAWKRHHLNGTVIQKLKTEDDMEVLQGPEIIGKA